MTEAIDHWTWTRTGFINSDYFNTFNFYSFQNSMMKKEKVKHEIKEFKVNFWDLSSRARFLLDKKFTRKLFESSGLDYYQLAKKLNISYPLIIQLRKNGYSISKDILTQLSQVTNIPLEDIQKNITSIKGRAGKEVKVQFPIKPSSEIASIVGHVFGDGYVGKDRSYFEYCNDNPLLIKEVKESIYKIFKTAPTTEKETRITYPTIIGDILLAFGAPVAPKIQNENLVPEWIFKSKEYKIAFLKAFFDDDGSVMLSKNYHAKGLNLHIIRHINHKESTLRLLNQMRNTLLEFGVVPGCPKISKIYEKKDGKRVICYLNITDYHSLFNYYKNIGLTTGNKFSKLKKIVKRKFGGGAIVKKPKKVIVLGSGSLKIGEAGETL